MTAGLFGIWPDVEPRPLERVEGCGCRVDLITGRMRRPCPMHEGEGHLSVVAPGESVDVVRCLRRGCGWTAEYASIVWAVIAGQEHWEETRARGG
jgi:hypothetical protein